MTIKIETCRRFLESKGVQVSTEAAAYLAQLLDTAGKEISSKALEILEKENAAREVQGLDPRVRLTAADIRRAIEEGYEQPK